MKLFLAIMAFAGFVFAQEPPADPTQISPPTPSQEKNEDVKGAIATPTAKQKKVVKDAAKKAKKKKLTKKKKKKKDHLKK